MGLLTGRSAIVTGGGRGVGREVALLLGKEGAKVLVCDPGVGREGEATSERPAEEVVAQIKNAGGTAVAAYDSVADYKLAGGMVDQCIREFGSVDLLINAAGVVRERMIWNMTEQDFDLVINVHLKGMWNMAHHAIKHMRQQGFGRIINFSSDAFKGSVGQCNYAAAKAGIIGLSRSIAKETYKYGITCNAICPIADTRMTDTPEVKANIERKFKAGLMSQKDFDGWNRPRGPEFIAPFCVYLCLDEAYYLNGQTMHVEKGLLYNYYFGEKMHTLEKDSDDGMFTVDELRKIAPQTFMGKITEITSPVTPKEAQRYVNQK